MYMNIGFSDSITVYTVLYGRNTDCTTYDSSIISRLDIVTRIIDEQVKSNEPRGQEFNQLKITIVITKRTLQQYLTQSWTGI